MPRIAGEYLAQYLYGMGTNTNGQLGLRTALGTLVPTLIGTGGWEAGFAASCAAGNMHSAVIISVSAAPTPWVDGRSARSKVASFFPAGPLQSVELCVHSFACLLACFGWPFSFL